MADALQIGVEFKGKHHASLLPQPDVLTTSCMYSFTALTETRASFALRIIAWRNEVACAYDELARARHILPVPRSRHTHASASIQTYSETPFNAQPHAHSTSNPISSHTAPTVHSDLADLSEEFNHVRKLAALGEPDFKWDDSLVTSPVASPRRSNNPYLPAAPPTPSPPLSWIVERALECESDARHREKAEEINTAEKHK